MLGGGGCWVEDDLGTTDLSGIPFVTPHVARGAATLQIVEATGYACPDGKVSQVYVVTPAGDAESYPLALLYHSRSFDYVDGLGAHYQQEDRLNSTWAIDQVRRALGMESLSELPSVGEGAWVAALLEQGFAVAAPANCWGDLWHGRGGNSLVDDGFLRLGAHLADDTIRIAGEAVPIDEDFVVAIGLGEGGRAITELALTGIPLRAVVIDSSPDLLSPLIDQPIINAQYLVGLSRIYNDEVGHLDEQVDVLAALLTSVQRDSMVNVVQNLGFRLPIVYAYAETDTRISPLLAAPAASAIETSYESPPGFYLLRNWPESGHALSNRTVDEARSLVAWLLEQTAPPNPAPGDDDSAAP